MKIALVCREWRQIALETPSLWTNISVKSGSTPIDTAKLYVERSQSQPLHFHATLTSEVRNRQVAGMPGRNQARYCERCELTELLLSCVGRLEHLSILIQEGLESDRQNYSLASIILSKFSDVRAPLLESLKLDCTGSQTQDLDDLMFFEPRRRPSISLFRLGAPRINVVEFHGIGPHMYQIPDPLQVTSFSLQTYYGDYLIHLLDLFNILNQMPALTRLTIQNTLAHLPLTVPEIKVELPNLLSLQIEPDNECTMETLLTVWAAISAPNLRHLSLSYMPLIHLPTGSFPIAPPMEIEFLHTNLANYYAKRSRFPLLESLDFHIPPVPDKVIPIFESFPSITSVSLAYFNSSLMITTMANDRQIRLWPHLKTIILETWDYTYEYKELLALLRRRKRGNSPIQRLVLRLSITAPKAFKKIPEALLEKLRSLVQLGVEIHEGEYCRHGHTTSGITFAY